MSRAGNGKANGSANGKANGIAAALLTSLLLSLLSSCATQPSAPVRAASAAAPATSETEAGPTVVAFREYKDPLIGFNRAVFAFNDVSYRHVLIPLARGYNDKLPPGFRNGVANFFDNLGTPVYLINNLLQLEPAAAGNTLLRFGINTTVGVLGIFDPATGRFDLPQTDTGFGDTLQKYGAGYGAYLVLPLLGSSDLRAGTGSLLDGFLHPATLLDEERDRILVQGFDGFQNAAPNLPSYIELTAEVEDPYIFMRNMYLQGVQRDALYGEPETGDQETVGPGN